MQDGMTEASSKPTLTHVLYDAKTESTNLF
jgi:hypothetical protein